MNNRNVVSGCVLGLGMGCFGLVQAQSGLRAEWAARAERAGSDGWHTPSVWPLAGVSGPGVSAGFGSHWARPFAWATASPSPARPWRLDLAWSGQGLRSGVPGPRLANRLSYSIASAAWREGPSPGALTWAQPAGTGSRWDLGVSLGLLRVRGDTLGLQAGLGFRSGARSTAWADDYTLGLSYSLGGTGRATAMWQGAHSGTSGDPLRSRFWLAWVSAY